MSSPGKAQRNDTARLDAARESPVRGNQSEIADPMVVSETRHSETLVGRNADDTGIADVNICKHAFDAGRAGAGDQDLTMIDRSRTFAVREHCRVFFATDRDLPGVDRPRPVAKSCNQGGSGRNAVKATEIDDDAVRADTGHGG